MFGDTGYRQPGRRRADVPRRERQPGAVQHRRSCPNPTFLWSPRVGFNWDVIGDQKTQVRGGTGVFTGKPAYVWISNQIGNTGVLTGFEIAQRTTTDAAVQPEPRAVQADHRDRRAGGELRARGHRPQLQVPADVADQHRRRPAPARAAGSAPSSTSTTRTSTACTTSTPTCRRRTSRSPAPTPAPRWSLGGTSNRINPHRARTPSC